MSSELGQSIRRLARAPGFTLTAIAVLALALYTGASIFAFVDAALGRPLPYSDSDRLVVVFGVVPDTCPRCRLSYLDYLDYARLSRSYASLDAFQSTSFSVDADGSASTAAGARVTTGFFRTLGVRPLIGHDFADEPPQGATTVLVSDRVWRTRYGHDPSLIGRTIAMDGTAYRVVGVLPPAFHFAPVGPADYWTVVDPSAFCAARRGCHDLTGIARLRDGISAPGAATETAQIAHQLEQQYADTNRGQRTAVVPLKDVILGDVRPVLVTLLIGAALLLVIALVNVTTLVLIRSDTRRHELAVRAALGASSRRLLGQLLLEASLLVGVSTLIALAGVRWSMGALTRLIPADMLMRLPFLQDVGLGARTIGLVLAITAVIILLLAVAPSIHRIVWRLGADLHDTARGASGRTWSRVGSKLVIVELAAAMMLVTSAALLTETVYRLVHVQLGFDPDRLAVLSVSLAGTHVTSVTQLIAVEQRVLQSAARLPGIEAAAHTSAAPVRANDNTEWIRIVGHPYHGEHDEIVQRVVSADYFQTIRAKLLSGRFFTVADGARAQPVTIINRSLAHRYFGDENPIGRQIGDLTLSNSSLRTIVGVIDDVREGPVESELWAAEYHPYEQRPRPVFVLVVRTSIDPHVVLPTLTAAVSAAGVGIVTSTPSTIDDRIATSPAVYLHRSLATIGGAFATISSVLGLVGLYGVVSYSVSRRTRELGIRVALGAGRGQVVRMVLAETAWVTGTGIGAGVLATVITGRFLRALLFGVHPWDPVTIVLAATAMTAAAAVAGYIPGRRAAGVDPMNALRFD